MKKVFLFFGNSDGISRCCILQINFRDKVWFFSFNQVKFIGVYVFMVVIVIMIIISFVWGLIFKILENNFMFVIRCCFYKFDYNILQFMFCFISVICIVINCSFGWQIIFFSMVSFLEVFFYGVRYIQMNYFFYVRVVYFNIKCNCNKKNFVFIFFVSKFFYNVFLFMFWVLRMILCKQFIFGYFVCMEWFILIIIQFRVEIQKVFRIVF